MGIDVEHFDAHVKTGCCYKRRDLMFLRFYTRGMGLRIKELRQARGLTQQQLADLARISRPQLSEIENERKPANTIRLAAIAKALNVSVDQLFTQDAADAYKSAILDFMSRMGPDDRAAILRMAEAFASQGGG
jgi:transcriptional regulator with XRE-family HTH domain